MGREVRVDFVHTLKKMGKKVLKRKTSGENEETKKDACVINAKVLLIVSIHLYKHLYIFIHLYIHFYTYVYTYLYIHFYTYYLFILFI